MAHYKGKYGNSGIIMGENYPASSQPPYSPPQCTYQFVTSTSPPRAIPRAFESIFGDQIPVPHFQKAVQMPHM